MPVQASQLIEHLESGGILARRLHNQIQYLSLRDGRPRVYGYGSATYDPESVKKEVLTLPNEWVCIEANETKLEKRAIELLGNE